MIRQLGRSVALRVAAASGAPRASASCCSPVTRRWFAGAAKEDPSWISPIEPEVGWDSIRGVRIKPSHLGLEGSPKELGSPTYPEFESIYEQDPVPGWGGSDEIFGVWGLDIEVAHVPRNKVVGMLLCGLGVFGLVGTAAYLVDAPSRKPAGPRAVY